MSIAENSSVSELITAIDNKTATVCVVGLGYVGLPLVRAFIEAGFHVIGFDVDQAKVSQLSAGESYIDHVQSASIAGWLAAEQFMATSDPNRMAEADAILICVPTPLTEAREPDLSYVEATARQIAKALRPGQLIVLESTTYPGTTRELVMPILETSGLTAGKDFLLAFSPEREDPGNPNFTAGSIPKVVGGIDPVSLDAANRLYGHAVSRTVPVSSAEVAEATKILENVYRAVNIALVNELKVLFDRIGVDVWEVIDAAKTKPFGFQAFYPGPGLGGHCIPIDPFYLSWLARKHDMPTRFIELAGEINTAMPRYVIDRVAEALNSHRKPVSGSRVLILGMAYKPNVSDPRESPSFRLMELLLERGAEVRYNDPHVSQLPAMRNFDVPPLTSEELTPELLEAQDCVLIATNHDRYDWEFIVAHSPLIVDTRNATAGVTKGREKVYKA